MTFIIIIIIMMMMMMMMMMIVYFRFGRSIHLAAPVKAVQCKE